MWCTLFDTAPQMLCPLGQYSAGGRLFASCSPCPAGSSCPLSASAPTDCPAGKYSEANAPECSLCPYGSYGFTTNLKTSTCTGQCPGGYACPAGSIVGSAASMMCPVGTFAAPGSGFCNWCPPGQHGIGSALVDSACSGACVATAGRYCPLGNTKLNGTPCPPGTYSGATGNVTTCIKCVAERPYSRAGSSTSSSCTSCLLASTSCDDSFGKYACPDMTWTPWVDQDGIEGSNSCLRPTATTGTWDAVNAGCPTLGASVHLLTTKQVHMTLLLCTCRCCCRCCCCCWDSCCTLFAHIH
jgi:hypothetical protein